MPPFKDYLSSTASPPLFQYYNGDVLQNLLKYLKYREIIIDDKILTVIEVYPSTLQFDVIMDGQLKRYYLNSGDGKVKLSMAAQMFVIDYINNQKKK